MDSIADARGKEKSAHYDGQGRTGASAKYALERTALSQVHIDRIRAVLLSDDMETANEHI